MRVRAILTVAACFGAVTLLHFLTVNRPKPIPELTAPATPLDIEGLRLRTEIEATHNASGRLLADEANAAMNQTISRHLAAGMSFDMAEAILKAAGCTVSAHPTSFPVNQWPFSENIVAYIPQIDSGHNMFRTHLTITLVPAVPRSYLTVGAVTVRVETPIT